MEHQVCRYRKGVFRPKIGSYSEKGSAGKPRKTPQEEGAYPKAGAITLRFIKSVVEAFAEGSGCRGLSGEHLTQKNQFEGVRGASS
jgi:hypothetical protein